MRFLLFSEISFEVSHPIVLIESYCFQNDFYSNYDLLGNRKIEDVNKIGARINQDLLQQCKTIVENYKNLKMFRYRLERFIKLNEKTRNKHIKDLSNQVIKELLMLPRIGFSRVTKILHTIPEIIPMIDNPLQSVYRQINQAWTENEADKILSDYYSNLMIESNYKNLDRIEDTISKTNLKGLTRIRLFDILWWSYLKANQLRQDEGINWLSMK
jgi:DNA-directed RNA polymerase subunit F